MSVPGKMLEKSMLGVTEKPLKHGAVFGHSQVHEGKVLLN